MRISSSSLYETTVAEMTNTQSRMLNTQRQLASGRKMITASDDPIGAARLLDISQTDAMNTQYATNRNFAKSNISFAEVTLRSVNTLLVDVRTMALSAGDGGLSNVTRQALASDLNGRLEELMGLANTIDESGNYLFSGFQGQVKPFSDAGGVISYFGDDGQRAVQVSASRQMDTSYSGADVFMRIKNGNGIFDTAPSAANTGTARASLGSTSTPNAGPPHNYTLTFNVAAGVTTYDVVDNTLGANIISGAPYVSGQNITFDNLLFDIKGIPNNSDSFTISPSSNESVFKPIKDLINALNAPVVGASLSNAIERSIRHIDHSIQSVGSALTTAGLHLNELDSLDEMGSSFELNAKTLLSSLQDVDYAKAASDLAQQNTALQAAQLSFAKVSGLSLFDYLR